MKLVIKLAMGALAAVVLGCIGFGLVSGDKNVDTPLAPAQAASPKAAVKPDTIGEGTWEVGSDVKPGKYKTRGALTGMIPLCYWDVQNKAGEIVEQGVKDKPTAQGIVTLKKGQTFTTSGCEDWYASK